MADKVFENIHRIVIPLPNSPLKEVNCYVIRDEGRDLIIDTGMNRPECRSAIESGLKELNVDLNRCDFFITHLHSDHMGQVPHLVTDDSTVYFNKIEAEMFQATRDKGGFGSRMAKFARLAGFSEDEVESTVESHPGLKFGAPESIDFKILGEGDYLDFGGYHFEVIHTPGHSPGHLCLYDADTKLMIAGDHVLGDITPNISAMSKKDNPLADFMRSLDKVRAYDVELALPGHRSLIHDFKGRVDELKDHHHERLDEVLTVMDGQQLSGYDIASRMKWRMRGKIWKDAGSTQKWFATGEAIAHLHYLQEKGAIAREERDGAALYSAI